MNWILVTYKLPAEPSSARVAVWREVRRSGGLVVLRAVIAFPDHELLQPAIEHLRKLVEEVGGETIAVRGEPLQERDSETLRVAYNAVRDQEYAELTENCRKLVHEVEREFALDKLTLAELDEEEAELEKLRQWADRIRKRDLCGADGKSAADEALTEATQAVARFANAVYERDPL